MIINRLIATNKGSSGLKVKRLGENHIVVKCLNEAGLKVDCKPLNKFTVKNLTSGRIIANIITDKWPDVPMPISCTVGLLDGYNDNEIIIIFSSPIEDVYMPDMSIFSVTFGGEPVTVLDAVITEGGRLAIVLERDIQEHEIGTVSYTSNILQGVNGLMVLPFTKPIDNHVVRIPKVVMSGARGNLILMLFDMELSEEHIPEIQDFEITTFNKEINVAFLFFANHEGAALGGILIDRIPIEDEDDDWVVYYDGNQLRTPEGVLVPPFNTGLDDYGYPVDIDIPEFVSASLGSIDRKTVVLIFNQDVIIGNSEDLFLTYLNDYIKITFDGEGVTIIDTDYLDNQIHLILERDIDFEEGDGYIDYFALYIYSYNKFEAFPLPFKATIANVPSVVYDEDTLALLDRFVADPSEALADLINEVIVGLKEDGVWDKVDCWWDRRVHTSQAACQNWRKNAHNSTLVNAPAFLPYVGFVGNGSTSYIDNNFIPSSHGGNFDTNDAFILFMHDAVGSTTARYPFGVNDNSNYGLYMLYYTTGAERMYFCSAGYNADIDIGAKQYIGYTRYLDTNPYVQGYVNGVEVGDPRNAALSGIPSLPIFELAFNAKNTPAGFYNGTTSFMALGGGLTAQQMADAYKWAKYFGDNVGGTF